MPNARELGFEGTVDAIRQLLARRFRISAESVEIDEPLFDAGVGLTSLEGMELLAEIESHFGVAIQDLDAWVLESPTLANSAQ